MNKEIRNLKERQKGLQGLEVKKKEQNNVIISKIKEVMKTTLSQKIIE